MREEECFVGEEVVVDVVGVDEDGRLLACLSSPKR